MKIKPKISVKTIDRSDGLPSGQIHELVQDSQGIFWFASPGGLARYDGSRIQTFGQIEGLQTHGLRAVAASGDGRVYVGSDVGIDVVEANGKIRPLVDAAKWRFGFVECLVAKNETLWLGTAEGLHHWSDENGLQMANDTRLQTGLISSLLVANNGNIWTGGPNFGLIKRVGEEWSPPKFDDWNQIGAVRCIAESIEGTIFLGGEKGLVEINEDGQVVALLGDKNIESVTAILSVGEELWIGVGVQMRLYKKIEGTWCLEQTVLSNVLVNAMFYDRIGNIWGSTDTDGVFKISVLRKAIIHSVLPDSKSVYSIKQTSGRTILLGGDKSSWKYHPGTEPSADRIEALNGKKVWDIIEDKSKTIWAATENGLYSISPEGIPQKIGENDGVLANPGRVILEREDGIWVGTVKGLVRINGERIETIKDDKNLSLGYVYTLADGAEGCLWIGTLGNGLWKKTGVVLEKITLENIKLSGNIYDVEIGDDGQIAVLQDNCIVVINPNGTTKVLAKTREAVAGWSALWKENRLWVGSSSGLHEYDAVSGVEIRCIAALTSLSEWEFTTSRSLTTDKNGRLLCGVSGGLTIVDVEKLKNYGELPDVILRNTAWTNAEVKEKDGEILVLPGKWTLDVDVFVADFVNEADTRVSFRLDGFDESWTERSQLAKIQYNSLPSGHYTLEAQAYNPLVGKSAVTKLFDLHVKSPWWSRGWLTLPYAASEAVLGLVEARWKNRRLLERTAELEEHVLERTTALKSAMDALRSANRELQLSSMTDSLTGVANRGNFDETLKKELERARRGKTFISLVLIDVDCFKLYNDTYGHPEGDECLRNITKAIARSLREGDLLARYGGEEFVIIVPNTDVEGTLAIAERSRRIVENLKIPHLHSTAGDFVTISSGVSIFNFDGVLPTLHTSKVQQSLIINADQALYKAKEAGRNRVVLGNEQPLEKYLSTMDDWYISESDNSLLS